MKILVVGSGAREHALVWKLSQEAEVFAAPGNPGMAEVCECFDVPVLEILDQVELARRLAVDLVVVGPEDPLIAGLADALRAEGIATFGPSTAAAQLEGSKAFSKQLMQEAGVPTASFSTFTDPSDAHLFASARASAGLNVVVKASGAALGKGVTVCNTEEEAHQAIDFALLEHGFGGAGREIVIEDRLAGPEFSLLTLCSDGHILSLPVAQDYKRASDGDLGPNTGGMGSFSPVPWITDDLLRQSEEQIVLPTLAALSNRGIAFRGMLFSGLMLVDRQPMCLEFNVRFGDPETQSIVRRIESGLAEALTACAHGAPIPAPAISKNPAVSIVLASHGYPGNYERGKQVTFGTFPKGVVLFHAGTKTSHEMLVTNGGRVLTVSASADNIGAARALAYEGAGSVYFDGGWYRRDIALQK